MPLYAGAVAAHTSLVTLGKGSFDYGEPIQRDLIHILENFANATAPVHAIEGQLWYQNSTRELKICTIPGATATWHTLSISGVPQTISLDMNNLGISNLAAPVNPNDAVNLSYANSQYVTKTADSIMSTGINLTFSGGEILGLPTNPSSPGAAASVSYVTSSIANLASIYLPIVGGTLSGSLSVSSGDVTIISGNLALLSGSVNIHGNLNVLGTSRLINFNNNIVSGISTPITSTEAANKGYVDAEIALLSTSYVPLAGGTVTGGLTVTGSLVLGSNMSAGGFQITNLGFPVNANDAASKAYVDASLATLPPQTAGADGVVYGGNLDTAGVLTLFRTQSLPAVVVGGLFAPQSHSHSAQTITVIADPLSTNSVIRSTTITDPAFPNIPLGTVIDILDRYAYLASSSNFRVIVTQTLQNMIGTTAGGTNYTPGVYTGVQLISTIGSPSLATIEVSALGVVTNATITTSGVGVVFGSVLTAPALIGGAGFSATLDNPVFTLNESFLVETNKLDVYVNGIKQIADQRGSSGFITSPAIRISDTLPLVSGTSYTVTIDVDGSLHSMSVVVGAAPYTLYNLINDLDVAMLTAGIPASVIVVDKQIVFFSNSTGLGSSVAITGGTLFSTLSGSIFSDAITNSYSYQELGIPMQPSNQILFNTVPTIGSVCEFIMAPF
jgi:hypothetical protein